VRGLVVMYFLIASAGSRRGGLESCHLSHIGGFGLEFLFKSSLIG
jgi:hypothetical protein